MQDKIVSIQGNGTWDSPYGLLYSFEYEFERGAVLSANHKTSSSPFNVGDVVEYEIKGTKNGRSWGKVNKPPTEGGSAPYTPSNRPTAGKRDDELGNKIDASWAVGQVYSARHEVLNPADGKDAETIVQIAMGLIAIRNIVIERMSKYGMPSPSNSLDNRPISGNDAAELGLDPEDLPF